MSDYKRVNTSGYCAYCDRRFDRGWSRMFPTGEITICDVCKDSFEQLALQNQKKSLAYRIGSKIKKLENAWLWFIAIIFSILGIVTFFIWIGSICMFLLSLVKGG